MLSNDTAEGLLDAARAALEALETIERRKGQQLWLDIAGDRFRGKAITDQLRAAIRAGRGRMELGSGRQRNRAHKKPDPTVR
jgi:hypothetical protein